MGVFGAGNSGAALNKFVAPVLMLAAGTWTIVPKVYAIAMLVTALAFWLLSASNPAHFGANAQSFVSQLALLKDRRVLRYAQYYSVVFGGYVGLSLWMPQYYVNQYGFGIERAAFLAACFSLPGASFGHWAAGCRIGSARTARRGS